MQPVIPLDAMKARIREIVLAGRSLEREALKDAVFSDGRYSHAAAAAFDGALDSMVIDGELISPGRFGPFQRAAQPPPPSAAGRSRAQTRLRSAQR